MGIISKAMFPCPRKGSLRILLREPMHMHIEKQVKGRNMPKHAQFKVTVQEGKTGYVFLGLLKVTQSTGSKRDGGTQQDTENT
jgi:hypothetical protein